MFDAPGLRRRSLRAVVAALAVFAAAAAGSLLAPPNAAVAAVGSQFDPGYIISDSLFYDGGAMGSEEIQGFLQSQVPACSSSYACLTTYRQNTPSMPAGRCAAYQGRGAESAADIIARVGAACGISQKVLLVTLQKEQGLVTNSAPSQGRFDKAMGMACPDTAPCDPAYSGFFYQVYYGARQFVIYRASAASFNFRAGRVNSIGYSPSASCGRGDVYIVNDATAGLYDYTPYQPNGAALANLYGSGDGCSSYGNRNFWRYYSDWFGSPTLGTSLIKSASSPDIYLTSGTTKYLITDATMLAAYANQGGVATVSDAAIASYTTSHPATRIIRSTAGAMYLHDAGIKLLLLSCDQVAQYGGSCSPSGYTQLSDYQVSRWVTGPNVGDSLRTITPSRYLISGGVKYEVLDDQSAAAASVPTTGIVLTEGVVGALPFGTPILRDDVLIRNKNGGYAYYANGRLYRMSAATGDQSGVASRTDGMLYDDGLRKLQDGAPFTGAVTVGSSTSILGPLGRYTWSSALSGMGVAGIPGSQGLLNRFPAAGSIGVGSFIKADGSPYVYYVEAGRIRPLATWDTFLALGGRTGAPIISLPDAFVSSLPIGPTMLQPAGLVVSASGPAVYFVDGGQKIFLPDFQIASAAGVTGYARVPDAALTGYTTATRPFGYTYTCSGQQFFGAGGSLHAVTGSLVDRYRLTPQTLDPSSCAQLRVGAPATPFIRVPSGAIYWMDAGVRRPVSSMERFQQLGGAAGGWTDVDLGFASSLPAGPAA